ncbi:BspA family leucine-rich repeat surface protein [bacterium]|nr:BspA family leucine-rich repeat surface protein [bacterium]
MECLFCGTEIDKLDLNSWDTRNVENMSSMFDYSTIGVLNLN